MALAAEIAGIAAVKSVEEVGEVTLNNGTTSWVVQSNVNNSRPHLGRAPRDRTDWSSSTAPSTSATASSATTDNTVRPDHRKVVGLRNTSGSGVNDHGTFSAGNAAGEDVGNDALSAAPNANNGNAPRARLTHGNLSDLDLNAGGGTSVFNYLTEAAEDGAFIHTNSWDPKNTTNYTQVSADTDRFTWENEDHLVVFGPDNAGPIRPGPTPRTCWSSTRPCRTRVRTASPRDHPVHPRRQTQARRDGARRRHQLGRRQHGLRDPQLQRHELRRAGSRRPRGAGRQYYTEGWYPTGTQQPHHRSPHPAPCSRPRCSTARRHDRHRRLSRRPARAGA